MKTTQNERITAWFREHPGKPISPADGFRLFGTLKLSTRIGEIKKAKPYFALRSQFKKHKDGSVTKVYWYGDL